ncbi:hypothetical protein [Acidisphaera sp. L21]|jgi:hypothetical protein|uniref:hypothetical protein n=1 Tax=Acidisphaera sp. L21 TaxID=1641851 RepID=UPI00131D4920|nr:hypothetical protein [Acidisphaera sp. L21]
MPLNLKTTAAINSMIAAEAHKTVALSTTIRQLGSSRSADPVQQMQTDAIIALYDAVKTIQDALWPMLLLLPDVEAARDAAQKVKSAPSPFGLASFAQANQNPMRYKP